MDAEIELTDKKLEQQLKTTLYKLGKKAEKNARSNKRLQYRIEDARKLNNPEGLPKKMRDGIKQATYLSIRNNPKDYTGNYSPNSILNIGKLTSGGADGLMLFAMVSDDTKAIEEMIKIGHDVNSRNKSGHSPLMFASAYNSPQVVTFLLSGGADPKAIDSLTEGNSLHVASRFNPKPETIEALVKGGFDIEAEDKDGNTALLVATKYNQNLQVVDKLLELGADIEAVDNSGKTSYSYAVERTQKRVPMGRFKIISKEYEAQVSGNLKP